jgi:hypothetical protein
MTWAWRTIITYLLRPRETVCSVDSRPPLLPEAIPRATTAVEGPQKTLLSRGVCRLTESNPSLSQIRARVKCPSHRLIDGLCRSMTLYPNPNHNPTPNLPYSTVNFIQFRSLSVTDRLKSEFESNVRLHWPSHCSTVFVGKMNIVTLNLLLTLFDCEFSQFTFVFFHATRAFDSGSGLTRTRIWLRKWIYSQARWLSGNIHLDFISTNIPR